MKKIVLYIFFFMFAINLLKITLGYVWDLPLFKIGNKILHYNISSNPFWLDLMLGLIGALILYGIILIIFYSKRVK